MPTADGAAAGGDEPFMAKADNFVPTFSGKQVGYKEFRCRCDIYAAKMKLAKRDSEMVFNIVTLLKGQAWDCIEDLSIEDFSKDTAYKTVFDRLDKAFKFDPLTELPADFEAYFVRLRRKSGHTVQQYQTEKVRALWFLRRSGLTKDQRQLVLTQLGGDGLTLDRVMKSMNFIIGQDSKLESSASASSRWHKGNTTYKAAYRAGDDDADEDSQFWDDDAYCAMTITSTPRRSTTMTLTRRWTSPTPMPSTTLRSMTTSLRPMSRPSTGSTSFAHQGDFSLWLQWFKAPSPMAKEPSLGGKSKARGKGKGKSFGKSPPQKGSAKPLAEAALGKSLCLRCGQSGHRAKGCPASSADSKKRKAGNAEDADVRM